MQLNKKKSIISPNENAMKNLPCQRIGIVDISYCSWHRAVSAEFHSTYPPVCYSSCLKSTAFFYPQKKIILFRSVIRTRDVCVFFSRSLSIAVSSRRFTCSLIRLWARSINKNLFFSEFERFANQFLNHN